MSVSPSLRPSAWNNSAVTGQIFMKFDVSLSFENLLRNFKIHSNLTRITWTLYEENKYLYILYKYIYLYIARSIPPRMIMQKCVDNIKIHISCSITFSQKSCTLLDNAEKYCRIRQATDDNTTQAQLHAGYLRLQTHTHNK
jgi:hypothetical protein